MTASPPLAALSLSVPNRVEGLAVSLDAVEGLLRTWSVDAGDSAQVMIIVDEIASNIISGAWPGDGGHHQFTLDIRIETQPTPHLVLLAVDDGLAFDPTGVPPPDLELDLDDREPGGLGLFMVKEMSDTVEYARVDGLNQLRITKGLQLAAPAA